MKVWAGFVCAFVLFTVVSVPAWAAAHKIAPGAGFGRITNYAETPAGIGAADVVRAESRTSQDDDGSALEIPEPAVIALFGLVALAIGHRLRRAKA